MVTVFTFSGDFVPCLPEEMCPDIEKSCSHFSSPPSIGATSPPSTDKECQLFCHTFHVRQVHFIQSFFEWCKCRQVVKLFHDPFHLDRSTIPRSGILHTRF